MNLYLSDLNVLKGAIFTALLSLSPLLTVSVFGQAKGSASESITAPTRGNPEVDDLRNQVKELRAEVSGLKGLLEKVAGRDGIPILAVLPAADAKEQSAVADPAKGAEDDRSSAGFNPSETGRQEGAGSAQTTQAPAQPQVAIATKAQGGDLAGAGNLLRTDRITIGGYGDFQYRDSSLSERDDGGGTPTFQSTRLVISVAAVLAQKQNIVFNSEIEYEFGTREIDVEQGFVEWKVNPQFNIRGGIFVPAIGRFNVFHDSNLNLATLRPLINQFILPTAYRDTGLGLRGRIKLARGMKLSYEADLLNGMQGKDADGVSTPFSRLLGQSSAAEPGLIAFQDTNRNKAFAGRIGLAPVQGLEFGASVYNGKFNDLGTAPQSVTILFFDGSYHRGSLEINGEYGRSNIVGGGIPRQSPAPPAFNPDDPASVASLAQFVAARSPGQDGFYAEGAYFFNLPHSIREKFDDMAYIAPVVRFEAVRLDRTLQNFYLNRSRATVGVNFAPASTVIMKFDYVFNHPFGPVPNVPGSVGGAVFGSNPIPYLDYGRNGFTGSVAYVF